MPKGLPSILLSLLKSWLEFYKPEGEKCHAVVNILSQEEDSVLWGWCLSNFTGSPREKLFMCELTTWMSSPAHKTLFTWYSKQIGSYLSAPLIPFSWAHLCSAQVVLLCRALLRPQPLLLNRYLLISSLLLRALKYKLWSWPPLRNSFKQKKKGGRNMVFPCHDKDYILYSVLPRDSVKKWHANKNRAMRMVMSWCHWEEDSSICLLTGVLPTVVIDATVLWYLFSLTSNIGFVECKRLKETSFKPGSSHIHTIPQLQPT